VSQNEIYIRQCALCGGELRIIKNEPMNVYHGDCWVKLGKKVGEK
jgi:hypothetical protein